jgi:hypothetical protein
MVRMKRLSGLLLLLLCFTACEKNESQEPNNEDNNTNIALVFYSLTTDKDTVTAGESATITAKATGSDLKYAWSATAGSILGSGNKVSYASCSCNAGENIITCTVTDTYNDSDSKAVSIFVAH